MTTHTIGGNAPAYIRTLIDPARDDMTRRSISRQVRGVVICTMLLVAVFLGATANAVLTIDAESTSADEARAAAAVSIALADGKGASNTLVREIARDYDLADARLARPETVATHEVAIPLTSGYVMAFVPRALGTETFRSLAPIRITIALVLAAFITLVLHRLHALARHMDMQRLAARRLATLDPLTGLSNRLHFNVRLAQQIDAAASGNGRAALLLLDLNGFKAVNDAHGHVAGDRLLQEVAERSGPMQVPTTSSLASAATSLPSFASTPPPARSSVPLPMACCASPRRPATSMAPASPFRSAPALPASSTKPSRPKR